jgi:serine protease Do
MHGLWRRRRLAWPLVTLAAVLSLVALVPAIGLTKTAKAPLWSETPTPVAAVTTTAPNWVEIAKAVKPAVVNISTKRQVQNDFFQRFAPDAPSRAVRSLGSGFVINADGHIVTNNHVVDDASEILVKLSDGRELPAKVVGRDPKTDLALLKIEATGLPVIPLGDSRALQVGEPVMAVGNPFGLEQTVTTGIVSATSRVIGEGPYDDFIQTDASINPGNSGGPLIDARGLAVGINTAIFSRTGGSVGIGFAIPIDLAKTVVAQLDTTGHVVRGWLGVTIQPVTADLAKSFHLPQATGALVSAVAPDSPAQKAGVKQGDVIVAYNGRKVARSDDLPRVVAETPVGHEATLEVLRDGKPVTLRAQVARLQEEQAVAQASSSERPSLGVAVQTLTPALAQQLGLDETRGVLVRQVQDGSPADAAGLRAGDVIVEVNRKPVKSAEELRSAVERRAKDAAVLLLVHREGANLYVSVKV